jgi:hypothetical protein
VTHNDEDSIEKRVERLEKAVFGSEQISKSSTKKSIKPKTNVTDFKGPKGGVLLLKEQGFLNTPRSTDEIKSEIEKNDFYYRRQVIQTALNRLSAAKGLLTAFEKNSKKVYVVRK